MAERFGQISTGALSEEDSVRQGFLDTEKHLNVLNDMSNENKNGLQNYKEDLGNEISSALTGLTASSSNADIVTALQSMFAKVKGLS